MDSSLKKIDESAIPREYQLQLLEEVIKMNSILYLPTGSGKTFIATMLIKHMGESLTKPMNEGRKWTFFVVHSVPLVSQQAASLRKHLPWNIGTFTGDMKVDFWSQEQWLKILEECHILVMTAQIYLNNLNHGYMKIEDANLIIFDECHHAVQLHPFRQIMQVYKKCNLLNKRPHILGLTATLVNSNPKNVKEELNNLQLTFNAKIISRNDSEIQSFSARPNLCLLLYNEFIFDEELKAISNRIKVFCENIKKMQTPYNKEPILENEEVYFMENPKQMTKSYGNYLLDINVNLEDSGVYAGYLLTWHYIVEIERKKKLSKDLEKYNILSMILSELIIIRKLLYDYMKKDSKSIENPLSIVKNVSPKLTKLHNTLLKLKRTDLCLVFVDRRTTAKMLYHFIKDSTCQNGEENIICDFVVGARGINVSEVNEITFRKHQNSSIIKKFNENKINVLITSEVLEEGIDIQKCNFVIRYDSPKSFPSFIQSKGRARSDESKFIILVPNKTTFEKTLNEYFNMESEIEEVLKQKEEIDDNRDEKDLEKDFKTKFATLTFDISIGVLLRYCYSLPQDRYTSLAPEWWLSENINDLKKFKLKLPINSSIRTSIDGEFFNSKKNAKKSVAFNGCVQLYNAGALDDNLLPINMKNNRIFHDRQWFPHWIEEDIEAQKLKFKPGTNKIKRMVQIESPSYLCETYPKVEKPSYLHIIKCILKSNQVIESKYETFEKLLKSDKEYGVLTSKKLPNLSDFPIFLNFCDVDVHIEVNTLILTLNHEDLIKLEQFHYKLFIDVLGVKNFVMKNKTNENNSYLIVPVYASGNSYKIDWSVISIDKFVETEPPTIEQKKSKFYEEFLKSSNVVSPWYRNITPIQRYVVTDVHEDMTPESVFPTPEYSTYQTYFNEKYDIELVNKNQPMIQVKSLSVSKINYLIPRYSTGKIDKRSEYIEILVPEYCIWHKFPSVYWLKSLMLPTILYRLNQLLLAEDLLVKINSKCNIIVNQNSDYDTLKMDKFCSFTEVKKKTILLPISETLKCLVNSEDNIVNKLDSNVLPIDFERQKNSTMLDIYNFDTYMQSTKDVNGDKNSSNNEENSIFNSSHEKKLRSDSINSLESQELGETIMSNSESNSEDKIKCKRPRYTFDMENVKEKNKTFQTVNISGLQRKQNKKSNDFTRPRLEYEFIIKNAVHQMNELNLSNSEPPILTSLHKQFSTERNGPKQSDILKVLTPSLANDMFSYERMETFGDSFLKFAVSLVLYDAFEMENEGVLSELKQKIVGNRNLLYIGNNINLGSYITINVFEPIMDWIPPGFTVPKKLKEVIEISGLPSDVLHQIIIPKEDQMSGEISDETWVHIEHEVIQFKELCEASISDDDDDDDDNNVPRIGHSLSDLFLQKKSVSDKMVADCVESLIGTYVYYCGIEGGFKIIQGLGIIPNEFVDSYKPKPDNYFKLYEGFNYSHILPGYEILENRIGYTFKHKNLLIQAVTHPTYQFGLSDCYQRLEFLGDAILDFLITTYIIEHCNNKSPGEITDIRSALVNNITFASLSIRIGLHKFLLAKSVKLTEAIDSFYEHQKKNNYKIGQEILYLIEERDCYAAESIDVPKVLGDLFESLIAAIYLDCNRDLNFVWRMCYRLMENEIKEFSTNVPKNPIRILHETKVLPNFSKPPAHVLSTDKGLGTMIQLDITMNNEHMIIYGFGRNKKEAKVAAAKMALKNMEKIM